MAKNQIKSETNPREGSIPSESLNTKPNSLHALLVFGIYFNYMSDYFFAAEMVMQYA